MFSSQDSPWQLASASLSVAITYQMLYYPYAYLKQDDRLSDVAGATGFMLIAWVAAWYNYTGPGRMMAVTVAVSLWAIRLGSFSYRRMHHHGREPRLDKIRGKPLSFLVFWLTQAVWSWLGTLPVVLGWAAQATLNEQDSGISLTDTWAIIFWVVGLGLETVADEQRFGHIRTRTSSATIFNHGVWRWSRHPNYFGEILHWFGISLACLPALGSLTAQWPMPAALVPFSPPFFTILLLVFSIGMPLSEVYHAKRAHRQGYWTAYSEYVHTTSPLIPIPPTVWRRLPSSVKCLLFERPSWLSSPASDQTKGSESIRDEKRP